MKTCPKHRIRPGFCPACEADIQSRPDPDTMTTEQRAQEMKDLSGPCFVHFDTIHKRIEELCGRAVWTHEMALWDLLVEEARTRQHPTMKGVVDRAQMLMGDKPVIVVNMDVPEGKER